MKRESREVNCADANATQELAVKLGEHLKGGEVIELVGDIGAGKTTFVKGLARGLGSTSHVSSPTFTISQIYAGRLELHHFDLYRLENPGLLAHEVLEAAQDKSVVVIEWANSLRDVLPSERVTIEFKIGEEESRHLKFSVPASNHYLSEALS